MFVRRQLRRANPMMDVTLFKNPVFSGSVSANLLSIFSLVGFLYFITQHLQLVVGLSPTHAAYVLVPGLAITIISGLVAASLASRFRQSWLVAGGLLLNATGVPDRCAEHQRLRGRHHCRVRWSWAPAWARRRPSPTT